MGCNTCLRLNISNCRVRAEARREALAICLSGPVNSGSPSCGGMQQIGVALDDGEDVVEIMGDARRELADGFHFLRVPELGLQLFHFGDVRAVAMDHLAGRDGKEGPGNGAAGEGDLDVQFFLSGGEGLPGDVRRVGRQNVRAVAACRAAVAMSRAASLK